MSKLFQKLRSGAARGWRWVADWRRRLLFVDWTWDAIGVALSITAVTLLFWLRTFKTGPWELLATAAADASVPLLVVMLTRYWYRYHRPGQSFASVVDLFNRPEVVTGVTEYLCDQMLDAASTVERLLDPQGADLGEQKYELATYLISWLGQKKGPRKVYRATFVGPFATAWDDWQRRRRYRFLGQKVERNLPTAFEDLARAATHTILHHRRLVALSSSDFINLISGNGEAFREFLQWHQKLQDVTDPQRPIRLLLFPCADDEVASAFHDWAQPGELVDYGIIGEEFVFGNPLRSTSLSPCVKLICRLPEVDNYVRTFDRLWTRTANFRFDLELYSSPADATTFLRQLKDTKNWPVEVLGLYEKEEFFA